MKMERRRFEWLQLANLYEKYHFLINQSNLKNFDILNMSYKIEVEQLDERYT